MDLGTKQPENMAVPTSPSTKEGKVYPSLYIDGEVAEQFLKECDCEIGDEGEAVVRFRLTGINKRDNGQSSVTLECRALMLEGEEDEAEESDEWQKREEEEGVEAHKGKSSRSKNPAVSKLMEEDDEDEEDEGEEED